MTTHQALFVLCVTLLCLACENVAYNVSTRDLTGLELYGGIVGDWQGELQLQFSCFNDVHSCAFEVVFDDKDYAFQIQMGPGCFPRNLACSAAGAVTNVTEDTITVEYTCPPARGCFCNETGQIISFCWGYTKQTMNLRLAMHLNPTSQYPICPSQVKEYCDPETGENVGLGVLDCAKGNCLVCRAETSCTNRGKCDKAGNCNCFHGFSGSNCSVSACPGDCNGHGICDVTKTKILMGMSIFDEARHPGVCRCVAGWSGADCSAADIYTGRQALWQGLIFIGVVTTVLTFAVVFKKFARASFRRRPRRFTMHRRSRRQRVHRLDVELDQFINPL